MSPKCDKEEKGFVHENSNRKIMQIHVEAAQDEKFAY